MIDMLTTKLASAEYLGLHKLNIHSGNGLI